MQKTFIRFGLFFLLFALLVSCSSKPTVVWDDSIPESELTTISFIGMTVTSYNGIAVENWNSSILPAGQTTFGVDVRITHSGIIFTAKDMEFTYYLLGGKEYQARGMTENMLWGIGIYEVTGSNPEFVAFTPFKNQPVFR